MLATDAARAAPAGTRRGPRITNRHSGAIEIISANTASHAAATDAAHHERAWSREEAHQVGSDWPAVLRLHAVVVAAWRARHRPDDKRCVMSACIICGADPCINASFCDQCRKADARLRAERRNRPADSIPEDWDRISIDTLWDALSYERQRPTPQSTIEAIMYCVREGGLAAMKEPANQERLSRCDAAARQQINERIERLKIRGVAL